MDFVPILEAGRRDFLDAAREISPEQALVKPADSNFRAASMVNNA